MNCRIDDLPVLDGQEVTIRGWVVSVRDSGKIAFLVVRDGTGLAQCVFRAAEAGPEGLAAVVALNQEAAVEVRGIVHLDARAPGGAEMRATGLEVISNGSGYPITPKEHGTDFLMDSRHLWLRSSRQEAILRVRSDIEYVLQDELRQMGFFRVDSPVLTPSACEGTTTLFETQYFGQTAYLSQSGQLYNEASAAALGRVYCFAPTFRAEKSKTRRHLMEFWMLEPEMAFTDLTELLETEETLLTRLVGRILELRREDLSHLGRDLEALERVRAPFPRLSYDDAVALLKERGMDITWGDDFGAPQETAIAEAFDRPVFVHRYPTSAKAFYMEPDPDRPEVCLSADLLAPEGYGEIAGGGQRISDPALLGDRLRQHDLPEEPYRWYTDLRLWGSQPHAGFGLGIERTLAWICGLEHVRETIPFPRLLSRIYP